jgi:hypothetical protein
VRKVSLPVPVMGSALLPQKIVRAELLSRRHAGRAVQVVAVINQSAAAHVKTAMKREPSEKHIAIAEIESGHFNGCRRE